MTCSEWVIAGLFTVGLFGGLWAYTSDRLDNGGSTPIVKVERPCVIEMPASASRVLVFPSKAGYDASTRAAAVKDTVGYRQAIDNYGGFAVDAGTTCLRLLESPHVRITSGPFKNQDVWLQQEWHGLD